MGKSLGINMINMYVSMVEKEFAPLEARIAASNMVRKEELRKKVIDDLGIAEKLKRRHELRTEIEQLSDELDEYTKRSWRDLPNGDHKNVSKIDFLVEIELDNTKTEVEVEIAAAKDTLTKQIKLAGVSTDVKDAFAQLAQRMQELENKAAAQLVAPEVNDADD